jgi:hypothetical protein
VKKPFLNGHRILVTRQKDIWNIKIQPFMITYQLIKRFDIFENFNRFSTFLLIGNSGSGHVNIRAIRFDSFEEVIDRLPRIINDLAFYGKWDMSLYQVPIDYQIIEKPKGYQLPDKGRRILKLDHQIATTFMDIFVNFSMIHLALSNKDIQTEISSGNTSFKNSSSKAFGLFSSL